MKILYIFPHPDDESFGPAPVIHQQVKQGHEVHLLTLTRGEATKMRYKFGLTEEQMAVERTQELEAVGKLLNLASLEILDFKDGSLAHLDPRIIEDSIRERISRILPQLIVTYPIHGISGHHDHLTTHAIVKSLFVNLKGKQIPELKRLAFLTLPREEGLNDDTKGGNSKVNRTAGKYIDAEIDLSPEDRKVFLECLDCYKTFQEVIEESGVKEKVGNKVYFEIFGEDHKPVLKSLTQGLEHSIS